MPMKITKGMRAALWAVAIAVPLFACSSSSSGGGGYGVTNCPAGGIPSACVSCLEANCQSQVNMVNSACTAFYDCICPAGQDAAVLASCSESESCASATATGMSQCTQCSNQCNTSSSTDGG
jgi:hypothetical protein